MPSANLDPEENECMAVSEPIFDDEAAPAAPRRGDPAMMAVQGSWYYPVTVLVPAAVFVMGYLFSTGSPMALLAFSLVGAMTGLVMTMIAMAWGVAIAFSDSAAAGLWFVLFPPYMPYFVAKRWRWMAQPTVLFLAGLMLVAATFWTVKSLTPMT